MNEKELKDHRAEIIEEMRRKHPKGFCYICGKGSVGIHHLRNIRTKGKGTITGEIPLCRCCHDAVEQTKKFKKLKDAHQNGKDKRNTEVKQIIKKCKVHNVYDIISEPPEIMINKKELLQKLGFGEE